MSDKQTVTESVEAVVHGRYLLRPRPGSSKLLVGFHGYAENAERNLPELLAIPGTSDWNVASIQALHPFYNLKTNEVVANWMTRLDRELAIEDNINYVRSAVRQIAATLGEPSRLVYAGFSQGTAMAYRAAASSVWPAHGLLILGGDLPPEIAERNQALPPVLLARGSREQFYTEEKLKKDLSFLRERATVLRYEGGHEWTDEFRNAAGEFLASL